LLLASLGTKPIGNLEANFDRVALSIVDAIQDHLLLYAILLLRSDFSAGLRAEL
jgi:hypothetical protein